MHRFELEQAAEAHHQYMAAEDIRYVYRGIGVRSVGLVSHIAY